MDSPTFGNCEILCDADLLNGSSHYLMSPSLIRVKFGIMLKKCTEMITTVHPRRRLCEAFWSWTSCGRRRTGIERVGCEAGGCR